MMRMKRLLLSFLNGLGWAGFGWVVMETEYFFYWIGFWALVGGVATMACAVDKMLEPKERWRR